MLEDLSLSVYVVSAIICLTPLVIAAILSNAHPQRTIAGVLYDTEQRRSDR